MQVDEQYGLISPVSRSTYSGSLKQNKPASQRPRSEQGSPNWGLFTFSSLTTSTNRASIRQGGTKVTVGACPHFARSRTIEGPVIRIHTRFAAHKTRYRTPPRKSREHPSAYHHGHTRPPRPISKRNETHLAILSNGIADLTAIRSSPSLTQKVGLWHAFISHDSPKVAVPSGDSGSVQVQAPRLQRDKVRMPSISSRSNVRPERSPLWVDGAIAVGTSLWSNPIA